ncbi:hypothetical protein [Burkholderia ambifaria]|uniref:hypothetical protein n=1 Tax=Burkholderia ambifaria TaxID=152480 RepID=UPI00158B1551|nr:hypothetical protein [Burkholderia ambifaria]
MADPDAEPLENEMTSECMAGAFLLASEVQASKPALIAALDWVGRCIIEAWYEEGGGRGDDSTRTYPSERALNRRFHDFLTGDLRLPPSSWRAAGCLQV